MLFDDDDDGDDEGGVDGAMDEASPRRKPAGPAAALPSVIYGRQVDPRPRRRGMPSARHRGEQRSLEAMREHEAPGVATATGPVMAVAVSDCGALLAASTGDHVVRLYDHGTERLLREYRGHPRTPWALAFVAARGARPLLLASACLGGEVRLWHPQREAAFCVLLCRDDHDAAISVTSLSLHPRQDFLCYNRQHQVAIWDFGATLRALDAAGSEQRRQPGWPLPLSEQAAGVTCHSLETVDSKTPMVHLARWYPDGKRVLTGQRQTTPSAMPSSVVTQVLRTWTVLLRPAPAFAPAPTLEVEHVVAYTDRSVGLSSCGNYIAAYVHKRGLCVLSARKQDAGAVLHSVQLESQHALGAVTCVDISPSAAFVLVGFDWTDVEAVSASAEPRVALAVHRASGSMDCVNRVLSPSAHLNAALFHPTAGECCVYGTREGRCVTLRSV